MATNELSRGTIVVLVTLAVILSVLSTTLPVTTVFNNAPTTERISSAASGQVVLNVPTEPIASGNVILNVP